MSERGPACQIDDETRFAHLAAAARPFTRSEAAAHLAELHEAVRREADLREGARVDEIEASGASFEKWRLLERWTRDRPYRDRARAKRSDVWREALERFRPSRDCELIDWLGVQVEVAANIEKGAPDMRPRDPRPTWLATLEYVSNRKRKALAVLHWARAAREDEGPVAIAAPRGADPARFGPGAGGHESLPWTLDEPG